MSGSLLSLAHGTNDAQKTMGVISLALVAHGDISARHFPRPRVGRVAAAYAIALGTYAGGWRIIRTVGTRIINMDSAQGFAAEGAGAAVILASSHFGYPLSSTHVISGGVIGAGAAKRLSAVRWGLAGNIAVAWAVTRARRRRLRRGRLRDRERVRPRRARPAARHAARRSGALAQQRSPGRHGAVAEADARVAGVRPAAGSARARRGRPGRGVVLGFARSATVRPGDRPGAERQLDLVLLAAALDGQRDLRPARSPSTVAMNWSVEVIAVLLTR